MRSKFKFSTMIFLFLALSFSAFAQRGIEGRDPDTRAKLQTVRMTEDLALSEKQSEKVGEINLEYAVKFKEARDANPDADRSAMRETMMQIRKEQNAELQKVLTTQQFDTWTRLQEERRQKSRERRGKKNNNYQEQNDENQ